MPVSADTLLDRLHLKRQIVRWRLATILTIIIALVLVVESDNSTTTGRSPIERPFIARLTIDGVVMDDKDRDKAMENIRENDKIKGLIVRLDTPGGSAVAGQEIYLQLRAIAEKKPVVAVMRDVSASAGFLLAMGADHVIARAGTLTGSIGVIMQGAEATELAQKIGINPIVIKTGPLKDAMSPTSKMTEEARHVLQSVVDDFFQVFVDIVSQRRHLPREEVLKVADGRVFSGRQALVYKMIDQLGGEKEAVMWMESQKKIDKDLEIKDIRVKKENLPPWLERMTDSMIEKILPTASSKLDGLVAIWHPSLQLQ